MKLHEIRDDFNSLISITADWVGVPESAVYRDYYIVMMLKALEDSEYGENCVFKGGTSLSKCYPGSIERFSEDIDLTYVPGEEISNKQYDRILKQIEKVMSACGRLEKIPQERNDRNKSSYVSFDDSVSYGKIKLEIGSSVRPDPFSKRTLKTYIQEYLESKDMNDAVAIYELAEVSINTLGIERTFLDKVMSVKRHAYCGTLPQKVRHIYDVTRLMDMHETQSFLSDKNELKRLIKLTKETDSFYLEKRGIAEGYNPTGKYDFAKWRRFFDESIRKRYESLHEDLLYTDEKQDFKKAVAAFERIDEILKEIGE